MMEEGQAMTTQQTGQPSKGTQLAVAIVYCLLGTVTVRYIRGVKR